MSRSNLKRRQQFRLSTIIVLTVVAGVLLGANVSASRRQTVMVNRLFPEYVGLRCIRELNYGWPVRFYSRNCNIDELPTNFYYEGLHAVMELDEGQAKDLQRIIEDRINLDDLKQRAPTLLPLVNYSSPQGDFQFRKIVLNFAVMIALLFFTAFVCERLARRNHIPHSEIRNPR